MVTSTPTSAPTTVPVTTAPTAATAAPLLLAPLPASRQHIPAERHPRLVRRHRDNERRRQHDTHHWQQLLRRNKRHHRQRCDDGGARDYSPDAALRQGAAVDERGSVVLRTRGVVTEVGAILDAHFLRGHVY